MNENLSFGSPTNKNTKMSSFKSSENIQKKEGRPGRSVSDNQSSSVTLNELAMKARKIKSDTDQIVYPQKMVRRSTKRDKVVEGLYIADMNRYFLSKPKT